PDLITVAKGIGNGFPLSAILIHPKFTPSYGMLGTTFGGNHLACAAALTVLEVMEKESLVDNARLMGEYLMEGLKTIPEIKEIRGRGLMIGLEFENSIIELRKKLLYEKKVFTGISGEKVLRLLPPLSITQVEADLFLRSLKEIIEKNNFQKLIK
ncbi:MAG: aminotransferase class III-fold pyridoxal phosphate-dependent enzyme, partial [Bacteroidales bacterium]|nr:aminotransferase class III-fold pyridoxal phosphate-dependent enzyme [Bacteroidales bacterium]